MMRAPQDPPISEAVLLMARMAQNEFALARAEIRANIRTAIIGAVALVVALFLLLVALNMLAGAAVIAIVGAGVADHWAPVIVGGATIAIAALLALWGVSALKPSRLIPSQTARRMRRDAEILKEMMRDGP